MAMAPVTPICPNCQAVYLSDHSHDHKWYRCRVCGYAERIPEQTPPTD